MANALLARPTNELDAGCLVGIVRTPAPEHYPAGTFLWKLTRDLNDLARCDAEFLPCTSTADAQDRLAALFPAPHPDLERVSLVNTGSRYSQRRQKIVPIPSDTFVVFPIPWFAARLVGSGGSSRDEAESVTRLLDLAARNGPFLITREIAEPLRRLDAFTRSDLVIAQESGCSYATVKFAPSKSQARRTRAANASNREVEAHAMSKAAAAMCSRIENLSRAIRQDLVTLGLGAALPEIAESHRAEDGEPVSYASRRRGWGGPRSGSSYTSPRLPRRGSLEILVALCLIHSRFHIRFVYRRLPPWEAIRSEFRALPPTLDPGRWGLHGGRQDLQTFWLREMTARRPKPVPDDPRFGGEARGLELPRLVRPNRRSLCHTRWRGNPPVAPARRFVCGGQLN